MGGQTSPMPEIPKAGFKPEDMALLNMQSQAGIDALRRQNKIALQASSRPMEVRTTDIYGPSGSLNQMGQIAAINAFKSKELEKLINPQSAQLRQQVTNERMASLDPNYWKNQMSDWASKTGV